MGIPPPSHPTLEGGRSTTETGKWRWNRGHSVELWPIPRLDERGQGQPKSGSEMGPLARLGLSLNSILPQPGITMLVL